MSCHVLPRNHTQRIKAKSAKAKASRSRVPSRPQETTPRDWWDKSDQKQPLAHLQQVLPFYYFSVKSYAINNLSGRERKSH